MGFVNKTTGNFNEHEYNWPEPSATTVVTPAFHVETTEDIQRKRFQSQSEIAISHSPYYTPEQKAGNQSRLRTGNVPQPSSIPAFKNIKTKRYVNLNLCEANWVSYLNSIRLNLFDENNPYVQDLAAGSVPSDKDIRTKYDNLIAQYNSKPFDPVDDVYVDGNGQVSTKKNLIIASSKTNPSMPTWDQFNALAKKCAQAYSDLLKKNKDSGIASDNTESDSELKNKLLEVEALNQKLKDSNTRILGNVKLLMEAIAFLQSEISKAFARGFNSGSNTTSGSLPPGTVVIDKQLEANYAVSNQDFTTISDLQTQADYDWVAEYNKELTRDIDEFKERRRRSTLEAAAAKAANASSQKPAPIGNPLLLYSSEIVDISISGPSESTVQLRTRDIPTMHCNERNEDTVSSLKLIKYSMALDQNTESGYATSDSRTALTFGSQNVANSSAVDLFETTNFVLQAVSETDAEKTQIIDNFGVPQIFMFGRRPRVYTYSGYLWNNKKNNWKNEFRVLYDKYLRGTSCVENGIKCLLTYDRSVRSGYMLNFSMNQMSDLEMAVSFNFSMFIDGEKELVDPSIFNVNDKVQNAFSLISGQATSVATSREITKAAIEKKLEPTAPEPAKLNLPAIGMRNTPEYSVEDPKNWVYASLSGTRTYKPEPTNYSEGPGFHLGTGNIVTQIITAHYNTK